MPENLQLLMNQAADLFQKGRLHDTISLCERILAQGPDTADALSLISRCHCAVGHPDAGLTYARRLLVLRPNDFRACLGASICSRQAGLPNEAVDYAKKATELQPNGAEAHCQLGLALGEAGRLDEAMLAMDRAIELTPLNPQTLYNLALVLELNGRSAEAIERLRQAAQLAPRQLAVRVTLANMLFKYDGPAVALQEAQNCLNLDPNNLAALQVAARSLANMDQLSEADAIIDRMLANHPNDASSLLMKGFRKQAKGDFEGSYPYFERSIKARPVQGPGYWGLAQGRGVDVPCMEDTAKVAIKLQEGSLDRAYVHFTLGKRFEKAAQYRDAMAQYDVANQHAATAQRVFQRYDHELVEDDFRFMTSLFTSSFAESNRDKADESDRPIFIVGMMRSGTTLLEQIVSSHSHVTAAGELQYWGSKAPGLIGRWQETWNVEAVRQFQSGYLNLLSRYSETGRLTDKMPGNARYIGLIKILFPHAKIIHMNRSMIDVGLSIYTMPYEISPSFAHVQAHIAQACRHHQRLMTYWRSSLPPGSFLDVSYAALVESPEEVIREVLQYCELPWEEGCLRHTDNARNISTPSQWQARQPIYRSSQGRWQNFAPYLGDLLSLVEA